MLKEFLFSRVYFHILNVYISFSLFKMLSAHWKWILCKIDSKYVKEVQENILML